VTFFCIERFLEVPETTHFSLSGNLANGILEMGIFLSSRFPGIIGFDFSPMARFFVVIFVVKKFAARSIRTGLPDGLCSNQTPSFGTFWEAH
jgi:hypothetical protein